MAIKIEIKSKALIIKLLLLSGRCLAWDVYPNDPLLSQSSTIAAPEPCRTHELPAKLDLLTAVDMSLCHDPQTREAWANIKLQQAELGQARAAYLPKLEGNVQWVRDHNVVSTPDIPALSTTNRDGYRSDSASLSWLLYDFGARSARHQAAEAGLRAALASQQTIHAQIFAAKPLPFIDYTYRYWLLWHGRADKDPAHRWFRGHVFDVLHHSIHGVSNYAGDA